MPLVRMPGRSGPLRCRLVFRTGLAGLVQRLERAALRSFEPFAQETEDRDTWVGALVVALAASRSGGAAP